MTNKTNRGIIYIMSTISNADHNKYKVRRAKDRGKVEHNWLKSFHSFSFGSYFNSDHMKFRSLRVINEDIIAPKGGFPTHPHDNMEIFSYVISGSLEHKDSMGNTKTLAPGDIQLMSAGSGITHSEYNPSTSKQTHMLQIWIQPSTKNLTPSYTEWSAKESNNAAKRLIISPNGDEGSAIIHQNAWIYEVLLPRGASEHHTFAQERGMWIQLISGNIQIGSTLLSRGDAIYSEKSGTIEISAHSDSRLLLFDLL